MSKKTQESTNKIAPIVDYTDRNVLTEQIKKIGDGKIGPEIACLIQSNYKVLYITTKEESRLLECLKYLALRESYRVFTWDIVKGLFSLEKNNVVESTNNEVNADLFAALSWIIDQAKKQDMKESKSAKDRANIYVMFDLWHSLKGDGNPLIERLLKQFSSIDSNFCIVIVSPEYHCPVGLESTVTLLDFPYPSKFEMQQLLNSLLNEVSTKHPSAVADAKEKEFNLLAAASGLTLVEAENAFAKSFIKSKKFDISTILEEKRQIIKKNGMLDYKTPSFTFNDIGGLGNLKNWLSIRKSSFSKNAKDFGIKSPKGLMLIGIPGTGKSMICEGLASYYEMPLLRLDMGRIFGSLVGESESNIRQVLKIVTSISPCILWIDEIEKGLAGSSGNDTSSGGGVTARVFGTLLTWMQESESVFVVCTGNNISEIRPEFLRAGRFDEIFFVDLPSSHSQIIEVVECLLLKIKRNPEEFDLDSIANASVNYSPAEIEKAINSALFVAFSDNQRKLQTKDILKEISKFQPLYSSRKQEIDAMRDWALGKNGSGGIAVLANPKEDNDDFNKQTTTRAKRLNDVDLDDLDL